MAGTGNTLRVVNYQSVKRVSKIIILLLLNFNIFTFEVKAELKALETESKTSYEKYIESEIEKDIAKSDKEPSSAEEAISESS